MRAGFKYLDDSGLQYFWDKIKAKLNLKQDTLVSGTNIKTINNNSILGSGNIELFKGLTFLSYGNSTWNDFITAYNKRAVVYCRASSGSNPASGSQTRLAFMAYVNNAENPTEVEFQYYRSMSSHTANNQGDQVFIYKLTSAGTWTVTTREASSKIVAGTNMSSTYSNGTLTLSATDTTYSNATTSSAGLMSATDKTILEAVNSYITGATNVTTIYPWDANNEYYQGDRVLHNNHFCMCRVDTATQGTYVQNEWDEWDILNLINQSIANDNAFGSQMQTVETIITNVLPTTYEAKSNKVTSISSSSTDTQYPSALAVYNYINSLNGNGVSY